MDLPSREQSDAGCSVKLRSEILSHRTARSVHIPSNPLFRVLESLDDREAGRVNCIYDPFTEGSERLRKLIFASLRGNRQHATASRCA